MTFALTHRGYFEVMFRPYLYRGDNPKLSVARNAAFDVLFGSARSGLSAHRSEPVTDEAVRALALAGWSLSHGLVTLALSANIAEQIETDPSVLAAQMIQGVIA
ncbi:TetR-like C-terminal domain-containing protein [Gordonia sp. CPCC 205333]|uniref:TetR-like C-terminal domain-containing protein n=1 Tax=Gordonia sp. CPCC 205333 TaxID=3140790 RepID=UPI003AF3CF40